jgi:hypothetical protein
MKRAAARSTARDSRSRSREAGCSRGSGPRRSRHQVTWHGPFSRARNALAIAAERIRRSSVIIEAGERLFAVRCVENDRHWRAVRRLGRVSRWLNSAGNRLFEAEAALRNTTALAYDAPYDPYADPYGQASRAVRPATYQLIAMVEQLMELDARLKAVGVCFREERKPGGLLEDIAGEPASRPLTAGLLRRLRGDEAKPITHQPYRQPIAISATAFRRVTRGRAPPALQLPTL